MLIPIWNFERKLKIMLNLCYLQHLFHILAITFFWKFQLNRDWCFLKENSILYNFYRNRGNQISTFSRPIMRFTLLLKIMTCFWACFFFLNFSWIISISKKFSKEQIRCPKGKHFFFYIISQKKWKKKKKSNQKSHLINFKLIFVRTNQN